MVYNEKRYTVSAIDAHFKRFVDLLQLPHGNGIFPQVILLRENRRYAVATRQANGGYAMTFGNEWRTAKEIIHWFEGAINYHYGIQLLGKHVTGKLIPSNYPLVSWYPKS